MLGGQQRKRRAEPASRRVPAQSPPFSQTGVGGGGGDLGGRRFDCGGPLLCCNQKSSVRF